jgi:glycosyltransferase involved in cell wall biosynthesis
MLTLAIPNYNGAHYLTHTLESLQANRPHVRWWLQDSCSKDDSVAIAQRFATSADTITVEKDSGQSDGLNRAFRAMKGDIIGFINSDDILAPGAAETVLNTFARHPEVDIVYGQVEWIDATGKVTGHHAGAIDSYEEVLNIYDVWWKKRQWVQPEVFWRRSLWDKVGEFDASLQLAFDYNYWVRCFRAGCVAKRIPQVLCQFRIHPAQKSTRAEEAAAEIRQTVLHEIRSHNLLSPVAERSLRRKLSYDCFHRRDERGFVSPLLSFSQALARNPDWLLIDGVRNRLYSSLQARFRP